MAHGQLSAGNSSDPNAVDNSAEWRAAAVALAASCVRASLTSEHGLPRLCGAGLDLGRKAGLGQPIADASSRGHCTRAGVDADGDDAAANGSCPYYTWTVPHRRGWRFRESLARP